MLLVIERVHYNALSMGKESHKTAPWYFAIMPEKDRATDIGNMHRKIGKGCSCCSGDILVDRQTDRQTDRCSHHNTLPTLLQATYKLHIHETVRHVCLYVQCTMSGAGLC